MIAVVIVLVLGLALAVIVAVGRDPGATPADVAVGYARAAGSGDFDAMYRMIDPDLLRGRNRPDWIAEQSAIPRPAYPANPVHAVATVQEAQVAHVDVAIDADRVARVELVLRNRVWTVGAFDGVVVGRPATR